MCSKVKRKVFLGCKGNIWAGTIKISTKNYQVWSHKGSTFFLKNMTQFGQNSRPRESDPSVESIRSAIFTVTILSGYYSITNLCALQPEAHAYGKSLHGADDSGRSGV